MTADEEDDLRSGTGDIPIDENGYIIGPSVPVRYRQISPPQRQTK